MKMYTIPILGRFVWSTHFVQCDVLLIWVCLNSRATALWGNFQPHMIKYFFGKASYNFTTSWQTREINGFWDYWSSINLSTQNWEYPTLDELYMCLFSHVFQKYVFIRSRKHRASHGCSPDYLKQIFRRILISR